MQKALIAALQNSRAFLFDMDGVLTDTMPAHCRAWISAFRKFFEVKITTREIYRREGEKSQKSVPEILAAHSIRISKKECEEFLKYKAGLFTQFESVPFFKGVPEMIARVGKLKTLALVTGTQKREVKRLLPKAFLKHFQALVTCDDVSHGKPHPEPYLRALELLKLAPPQALVIENAPLGIRSAKSAGLAVCAIATSLPAGELTEADFILKNHEAWFETLQKSFRTL